MFVAASIFFALHQRLRLGQHIGQQGVVVARQAVAGLPDGDKLHRHHRAALVQHLEVGMLAVGAGLAPQHGRGGERQRPGRRRRRACRCFPSQAAADRPAGAARRCCRRDAAAAEAVKVAVPDVEQAQAHRQVARQRGRAEMFVHGMRAGQQLAKARRAYGDGHRQAYGRPQRITPAHPVPEAERGLDAEGVRGRDVGRERREMPGDVGAALRPRTSAAPSARWSWSRWW